LLSSTAARYSSTDLRHPDVGEVHEAS
jgi:hypothetical protein